VILITTDTNFKNEFLRDCTDRYGPRNRRGFAKVFSFQNFDEALSLFHLEQLRYVVVIDNNIEGGNAYSFFAQVQEKLTQQLMLWYDKYEIKTHKRIVESQIFLVLLEDKTDLVHENYFPTHTQVWHLQKPVTLEELDAIISPAHMSVEAQWLRNPITYLPSGILIPRKIEEIVNSTSQVSFFVKVVGFGQTKDQGIEEIDHIKQWEIVHFVADIIEQAVEEQGNAQSWIGQEGGFNFFVVIEKDHLKPVTQQIEYLFKKGIQVFCSPAQAAQLSIVFYSQYEL
jgi:hypothetical protein